MQSAAEREAATIRYGGASLWLVPLGNGRFALYSACGSQLRWIGPLDELASLPLREWSASSLADYLRKSETGPRPKPSLSDLGL